MINYLYIDNHFTNSHLSSLLYMEYSLCIFRVNFRSFYRNNYHNILFIEHSKKC